MGELIYHSKATDEIRDAARAYEKQRQGLGVAFVEAVERTAELARATPTRWRKIGDGCRRVLVDKFPYGLIYAVQDSSVYVLAVMHLRRKPDYWRRRVADESRGDD